MLKEIISFEKYRSREEYDFGLFPPKTKKHTIKVAKEQWLEYVKAREHFERLHYDLVELANKK